MLLSESFRSSRQNFHMMGKFDWLRKSFPPDLPPMFAAIWATKSSSRRQQKTTFLLVSLQSAFSRNMFEGPQIYNKCFYMNSFKAVWKKRKKFRTFFTHFLYHWWRCQREWVHKNKLNGTAEWVTEKVLWIWNVYLKPTRSIKFKSSDLHITTLATPREALKCK